MSEPLCDGCGAKLRPEDRFCSNCGARVGATAAGRVALQVATPTSEERRVATILFADVVGSTALGERLDPEELREVMASLFRSVAKEVHRYGGIVNNYMGDGLMAVFGAPVAHEDDAERAVHAAAAIQREVRRLSEDLERAHGHRLVVRVGVNTGDVIAGELAGDVQSAYTVTGDAVNTAQRIQAGAPPGIILVGPLTARLVVSAFELGEVVDIPAKGKAATVPARPLLREREERSSATTPLVDRVEELAELREAVLRAAAGRGSAITLVGETGVGKTRLADELSRSVGHIGPVQCPSYRQIVPYAALAGLLRAAFGLGANEDETATRTAIHRTAETLGVHLDDAALPLLLDVFGVREADVEPEVRPRILLRLTQQVLGALSSQSVCVVLIDDVHWMDEASARTIAQLVTWIGTQRLLLLCTARGEGSSAWDSRRMDLGPLLPSAARELAERRLASPLDDAASEAIAARARGNPLFIEELTQALGEAGALVLEQGVWRVREVDHVAVPRALHELIAARLDRLPADTRMLLQDAAVLGQAFRPEILERMSGATTAQLQELVSQRLLIEATGTGTYGFAQDLVREVLYTEQLAARRRERHARAAAAYEMDGDVEAVLDMLAHHYDRAEDPRAPDLLMRAGERAFRLHGHDEALAYFRRALERSSDPEARAAVQERLGDVLFATGRYPEALGAFEAVRSSSDDALRAARAVRKTAAVHRLASPKQVAREHAFAALQAVPDGADVERAEARIVLGLILIDEGQYDPGIEELQQAIADAERSATEGVTAEAYKHLGTACVLKGESARGLAYYERALETYTRAGSDFDVGNVVNNIAIVHKREARYAEALEWNLRALAIRGRIGDPLGMGTSRNNLAEVHLALGHVEDAAADYAAAAELWRSIGYEAGVALASVGLGATALARGDAADALRHLRPALSEWDRLGMRIYVSETERSIAEAHLVADPHAGVEWADRAASTARELGSAADEAKALRVLGVAHLTLGQHDLARDALERSRDLLVGSTDRLAIARTLAGLARLRAATGDDSSAAELGRLARDAFVQIGASLDLALLDGSAVA